MSISRLTKPSAQMLAGRRVGVAGVGIIQVIVPLGTGGLNLAVKKAANPGITCVSSYLFDSGMERVIYRRGAENAEGRRVLE